MRRLVGPKLRSLIWIFCRSPAIWGVCQRTLTTVVSIDKYRLKMNLDKDDFDDSVAGELQMSAIDERYAAWLKDAQEREADDVAHMREASNQSRPPIPNTALPSTYTKYLKVCNDSITEIALLRRSLTRILGDGERTESLMPVSMKMFVQWEWLLSCVQKTRSNLLFLAARMVDVGGFYGSQRKRDVSLGSEPTLIIDTWMSNVRAHGVDALLSGNLLFGGVDKFDEVVRGVIDKMSRVANFVDTVLGTIELSPIPTTSAAKSRGQV